MVGIQLFPAPGELLRLLPTRGAARSKADLERLPVLGLTHVVRGTTAVGAHTYCTKSLLYREVDYELPGDGALVTCRDCARQWALVGRSLRKEGVTLRPHSNYSLGRPDAVTHICETVGEDQYRSSDVVVGKAYCGVRLDSALYRLSECSSDCVFCREKAGLGDVHRGRLYVVVDVALDLPKSGSLRGFARTELASIFRDQTWVDRCYVYDALSGVCHDLAVRQGAFFNESDQVRAEANSLSIDAERAECDRVELKNEETAA